MALIRVTPLKDFLDTALSTTQNTAAANYSTALPNAGESGYYLMHLTSVGAGTTTRLLVATVQAASSSGFAAITTEATFSRTSSEGSTWVTLTAPSTDRPWRRAVLTMSTAASTANSWKGLVGFGFRSPNA